ncbi:class I SAM-dependent methyltransferase [Amycolatopsis pigmentata]|uniref:Class I SAM-dependent methyltransferase n=1 Tax=Amycolatopsis pigmentata TaxID=450801 RepID=A0ABW5FXW6_9PSEU
MAGFGDRLADRGFGHPRGVLGRMGGWLMARGNAATERHLAELAHLSPEDAVLVLGPGPGVGLHAAGTRAGHVVGVDPSDTMLAACRKRCAALIDRGVVELARGDAANTGQPDACVDVVLSVNNVMLWPDWPAAFTELKRVLRPGGRILLSAHAKWLPGGSAALAGAAENAGFREVRTWAWEPPGRASTTAAQLIAYRPRE